MSRVLGAQMKLFPKQLLFTTFSFCLAFVSAGCAQPKPSVQGAHPHPNGPEFVGTPLVLGTISAAELFARYPVSQPEEKLRTRLAAILADAGRTIHGSASAKKETYTNGDLKVSAWVRIPGQCQEQPCPVIVEAYSRCFTAHYHWRPEFFMHAGFIVVEPNIRGSSCSGNSWRAAAQGQRKFAALTDIEACGKWAKRRFTKNGVTPKIGIVGWSYGGFVTLLGMTRFSGTFDAGFALAAKTDLYSFFKNAPQSVKIDRMTEYGNVDLDADRFKKLSPISYVDQVHGPIAMILGGQDPKVSLSDTNEFVNRLRGRNQDVSLMIIPENGHLTESPDEITFEHAHIIQFFSEKFNIPVMIR